MALTTGPNLGLLVDGNKGEAHYDALMRFLRGLDTLVQPRVSTMTGTLPTTGLVDGLTIVYTGNDTNKNKLARYSTVLAAWEYYSPRGGWEVAVVDQLDENGQFKKYQYTGTDWVEKLTAGGLTLAAGDARYEKLIKHNVTATTDPTVSNDSTEGYAVLSRWVNTTTKESFLALDVAPGAANWQKSTLTVDELGSAALATVGLLDSQIPTVATVKNLLATLAVFGAGSAAAAGTKGLVPAPPQSEVLRFLRSDGVWAFFEIPEGTELSKGANIGEGTGTHGIYLQTVGDTLQFKSLVAADDSIELTSTEGQVRIKAKPSTPVDVVPPISVGSGIPVYAGMNGAEPMIRSIKAGANMTVTLEGDTIMLASTGGSGGPVTQTYPYVDGPFFRSDTLWPFSTVVSDLPSATLTASGATLDYTTPQGVDGVAYSAVVVVLGVEQDTPVRVIVSEIHSSGPNWNYIRMASAETQDHGGGDEITIGQPFQGTLSTGTDRVVIYGSYPSDHIDRLLASVEVQVDGVWVGAFTLPGKAPGGGGVYEPPVEATPTSVAWTDLGGRISGVSGTPIPSITAFDVSIRQMSMQPMGVLGHATGAKVFWMEDGQERFTNISEMEGLRAERVYAGAEHMFAIRRSDGSLITTYMSADYAWVYPDFGGRLVSTAMHISSGDLWLAGLQSGAICTFGTFPGAPVTDVQASTPAGEIYDFARNPTSGVIIGVGYSRAVRTSDVFANYTMLEFMPFSSEWCIAADDQGRWAMYAMGREEIFYSHDDGETWTEVLLPKMIAKARMQWSGGVFLLSGAAGYEGSDPALFFTSLDGEDWNEIPPYDNTPSYGARIFEENRIMYVGQVWQSDVVQWYEGVVTPGTAGSPGGGTPPGGSLTINNAPGGVPLLETWGTGDPLMRSLVPGIGVDIWPNEDGQIKVSAMEPVLLPSVGFFALRDPETDTYHWVPSWEDQRQLNLDDPEASIWHYLSKVVGETTTDYVHEAYVTYTGSRGMPWWGLRFQIEDQTTWFRLEIQELFSDVPGSFAIGVGSDSDPYYHTPVINLPQGSGGFGNVDFVLEPWSNENMLRIVPPEGSTDFGIRVIVAFSYDPDGPFMQVGLPKIGKPFEGGENDPSVPANWAEFSASGSNGWGTSDGWSSPSGPRMRLAFGMVEMLGVVVVTSETASATLGTLDWAYAPRNARENAAVDPEALFPVAVDTEGVLSTAHIRVLGTGELVISPVPALGAKVHLTGIRFPSRWPSAHPT